jgi:Holliday junction resolvase-like predicted endonuclease
LSWSKGEIAEDFVAQKLEASGWTLAIRNYRRRGFEIDIIAHKADRLLCIEVKARAYPNQDPRLLINPRKFKRLSHGMAHWLQTHAPDDSRNAEFWLCIVELPLKKGGVQWLRLESLESRND